jgi:hypothetical protein
MADEQLQKLADDIKINGLLEPATITNDNLMLDGHNRDIACEMAGVELRTVVYKGNDEIAFVISKNLHRRHLPLAELAMIGADLATLKSGKHENRGNQYQSGRVSKETLPLSSISQSAEAVGKQLGIGRASIMDAKAIKEHGTAEIIDMAKAGKVCLRDTAAYVRNTPKAEQKANIPEIRKKGNAINKGKATGRKTAAKVKAEKKPDYMKRPPMHEALINLNTGPERTPFQAINLLPPNIEVLKKNSMMLGTIAQLIMSLDGRIDIDVLEADIQRLLAYKPINRYTGEDRDYAKETHEKLAIIHRHATSLIEKLSKLRYANASPGASDTIFEASPAAL